MADLEARLLEVLAPQHVQFGDAIGDDYTHDEALTGRRSGRSPSCDPDPPRKWPQSCASVTSCWCRSRPGAPGPGCPGACTPRADGIVLALERMNEIVEIDTDNYVAVVQPGVSLDQLDAALAPLGLVYPVCPGENSASLGGNVATNAGGMRAVKYGVTRHQVLGLEAVLADGDVIRTGGKFVKATTGYDLTQLIIGSEGTLAIVTEADAQDLSAAAAQRDDPRAVRVGRRDRVGRSAHRAQRREPARARVRRRRRPRDARGERRARSRHQRRGAGGGQARISSS